MRLRIYVTHSLSGGRVCEVSVQEKCNGAELKGAITKASGIPFHEQILHRGQQKLLDEDCVLTLCEAEGESKPMLGMEDGLEIMLFRRDVARAKAFELLAEETSLKDLALVHRGDPEIVKAALVRPYYSNFENSGDFMYASEELKDDYDFVMELLTTTDKQSVWRSIWPYISERLRGDREIALTTLLTVQTVPFPWEDVMRKVPTSLLQDRSFLLAIASYDSDVLSYASSLSTDMSFVLAVLRCNTFAFKKVSDSLWCNEEFLNEALKLSPFALDYVPIRLWEDRSFVLRAVQVEGNALARAPKFESDMEIAMVAVSSKREALSFVAPKLRRNLYSKLVCR